MRNPWNYRLLRLLFLAGVFSALAMETTSAAPTVAESAAPAGQQPLPDVEEIVEEMSNQAPNYHHPPLKVELPLFVFTLIFFGVFVLLMRPFVWTPLMNALNAREGRIVKAEAETREAQLEVRRLTERAEQRMAEVHQQVAAMLSQARAEAETQRQQVIAQAAAEAQRIKDQALVEIAQARSAAMQELEQALDHQVALASEHVAGRRF
jgi:F-type H+-transporting ATPase subunit b